MEHDVFISYSSKEKSVADGVCHYLEDNGVKCWMAPRDIPVGTDYGDLIDEAIKSCRVVVLVYSQHSFISKWVKGEINVAFDEGKPIAPFRIDETGIKGAFRVMLNQMHWIDAYPSYADRLPDLLRSICGFIGREVPEHQPPVTTDSEEPTVAAGSEEHFLKVRCTLDCRLFIDRDECANIKAGGITKVPLHQGEYLVQVSSLDGLDTMEQELDMPAADKLLFFDLLALQKERLALEQKRKEEAERKAREEAARKAKAEEERKKQEEAERKAKEEAARKAKEEAERRAKEEAERRAKEEAERRAKEDAERKAKEEAERKAKEEAERKAKEKYTLVGKGETILGKKPEFEDLVNVSVDKGVLEIKGAFFNCKKIKKVKLNSGLKIIRKDSFYGCKGLEEINIPDGVHTIERNAFQDCISLKKVNIPGSVITICGGWISGAFNGCKNMETLVLNEGLEEIQRDAFGHCEALRKVVIPSTVRNIEKEAFNGCKNLKTVVLKSKKTNYSKSWRIFPSFPESAQIIIEEK